MFRAFAPEAGGHYYANWCKHCRAPVNLALQPANEPDQVLLPSVLKVNHITFV